MPYKHLITILFMSQWICLSGLLANDKPQSHSVKVPEPIAKLVQAGNFKGAQAALENDEAGKNDLLLAWILLKQGQNDAGIKRLKQSWNGHEPSGEELRRAIAVISDVSLSLAETTFNDLKGQHPQAAESAEVTLLMVMVKARLGKIDEASQLADAVIDSGYTGGGLKESLLTLSTSMQTSGRAEDAIKCLERLFKLFPEASLDPAYKMQLAHQFNTAEKPTEALAMIDQIETNNPDYAESNRHLLTLAKGVAYEAMGDRPQAMAYWKQLRNMGNELPAAKAFATAADAKIRQFTEEDAADERAKAGAKATATPETKTAGSFWNQRLLLVFVNCAVVGAVIIWVLVGRRRAATVKK